MSHIIILNGIGSAGKSSIARAFQVLAPHYLHVQMDAFLDMIPPSAFGKPEGLVFETQEFDGHPSITIRSGPLVARAMRAFRASIAAMAADGLDLIVDDVLFTGQWTAYDPLRPAHRLTKVAVTCPLDILEAREAARGDRAIGLARGQWHRIDHATDYALTLDSSRLTPEQAAAEIARHLEHAP